MIQIRHRKVWRRGGYYYYTVAGKPHAVQLGIMREARTLYLGGHFYSLEQGTRFAKRWISKHSPELEET